MFGDGVSIKVRSHASFQEKRPAAYLGVPNRNQTFDLWIISGNERQLGWICDDNIIDTACFGDISAMKPNHVLPYLLRISYTEHNSIIVSSW